MNYMITSAAYANPDSTSAVIQTTEAGAVVLSEADTPDDWAALVASGVAIAAFGASLDDRRSAKLAEVEVKAEALITVGAPYAYGDTTYHIALDDGARTDLTAMASTAIAASSGAVSWPASYSAGWITTENIRIPLATAADGLGLAASVGDYYAQIIQHRRSLKDAILTAADIDALAAIDVSTGWPS